MMNDSAYAYDVSKNLVNMGEVLFTPGSLAMKDVERSTMLDENEVDRISSLEQRIASLEQAQTLHSY